jgi:hypothetical protein
MDNIKKPEEQVNTAPAELSQEELDKVSGGNVVTNIVNIAKQQMADSANPVTANRSRPGPLGE